MTTLLIAAAAAAVLGTIAGIAFDRLSDRACGHDGTETPRRLAAVRTRLGAVVAVARDERRLP